MTDPDLFTCSARRALRQELGHLLPRDREERAMWLDDEAQSLADTLAEAASDRVNELGCRLLAEAHGYVRGGRGMSDVTLRPWLVLRYEPVRDAWTEVACTNAVDAGTAFRDVVFPRDVAQVPPCGEYRVVTLEDSVHLAVEIQVRDLEAS